MAKTLFLYSAVITFLLSSVVQASRTYQITVSNGGPMPVSPGALYVTGGQTLLDVGIVSTAGLIHLCQTGDPSVRLTELQQASVVASSQQTAGPILPGQNSVITVELNKPSQAIHFEGMYGLTKDTCAIFGISSDQLNALSCGSPPISGRDSAVATGAFGDPMLSTTDPSVCDSATSAVNCLRLLETAQTQMMPVIRAFPGYLPSVLSFLEEKYGPAAVQQLLLPTGGAVRFSVQQTN